MGFFLSVRRVRPAAAVALVSVASMVAASGVFLAPVPAAALPPSVPADRAAGPVGAITWTTPCAVSFACGRVQVPLDHDHPGGAQVSLALAKLPATDPARKIGTVFVNPGGPGGSGVDFVLQDGPQLFTPEVRARFDIVGFDPRGISRSTPLRCFATADEAAATVPAVPYPTSRAEVRDWVRSDHALDAACAARGGPILDHMSTADVARDLDVLRQGVGDRYLTYYGVSYGSFLGATYANLFPGRFRALAIDGVLDPVAWTTGRGREARRVPFSTRVRSAAGARDTLEEFFRLCDAGGADCAFGPDSAERYASLYRTLKRHPVDLPLGDGSTISYDESFLVADTLGALYNSSVWPDFAAFLAGLAGAAEPSTLAGQRQRLLAVAPEKYENAVEGFPGVACSDSVNPRSYRAWVRAARDSKKRDGIFGPLWTWASGTCADWPGQDRDRYLGPFTARTRRPVLVVGNQFDPATPYQTAQVTARLLPNSRLLTLHAWGHTSLFRSACADQAIARYLLTGRTPPRGKVCEQDVVPFRSAEASARGQAAPAQQHASVGRPGPHW